MITCPTCGAQNDPANRFCDQCGTRLDAAANTATPAAGTAAVDAASQPTATATTCPSCGAMVLPGEAFCDSCGAALPANTATAAPATASNDAPTMLASPTVDASTGASADGNTTICPVCGHHNMPGDRFCDNCGADLQAPAPAQSASSNEATVVASPDAATALSVPTSGDDPPALPPSAADQATQVPISVEPTQAATEAAVPTAEAAVVPVEEPVATATIPEASPAVPEPMPSSDEKTTLPAGTAVTPPAPDTSAERARLEEVIATQQRVITQLEQTQSALGAATPAAILQTLQDARNTLSQAESDLQMLPAAKPAVDPAEIARLEEAVATQQKVVDQLEQTQAALGAATPEAIKQALQSARDALAQAQGELQTLTGAAPATSAATSGAPSADAAASTSTTQTPAPAESQPPAPPVATPPAPAPAGPRLVMVEGNKELTLPTDKAEIVIGREDPISQIFPEVDLTPFGGESGGVSRQHARLNHQNGQWTITDLNSTNYTRVEGAKIDPNTPVAIQDGTRLQFGRIATVFHT